MSIRRAIRAAVLVLSALSLVGAVFSGGSMRGGSVGSHGVTFTRTSGLQTNATEIARHVAFASTEPYATDRTAMQGHATTARDAWPYEIEPGPWEGPGGVCEPVGETASGSEYRLELAATDIFALALSYATTGTGTYAAAARTRILEYTAITDFEASDLSGANQCILDLGEGISSLLEAAWLLEDTGYSGWTNDDRIQLANWLAAEVVPVLSWAPENRKPNWGIVGLKGMISIAAYLDGGVPTITLYDASTMSPAAYIEDAANNILPKWLSDSNGDELDSDCQDDAEVFGLQSYGAFPDELRREDNDTADCAQTSLAFACTTSTNCGGDGGAHFYSHKATNSLAAVCAWLERLDGDGSRCWDLTSHGGDDTIVQDAYQFATGGDYQTYFTPDTMQGTRYLAGEYFDDGCILDALDSGSVSVRGGRDVAYSKITHAPGVRDLVNAAPCAPAYTWSLGDLSAHVARIPDISNPHVIEWADAHDTVAKLQAMNWDEYTIQAADCADNGATSGADNGVIASAITTACTDTDCDEGNGGTIFFLDNESTCVFDVTSTVAFSCSNCALVETPGTTATISCNNNTVPTDGDDDMNRNECFTFGNPSTTTASSQTWTGGDAQGEVNIEVSSATAFSAGDLVQLTGNTSTGTYSMPWVSRVASVTADGAGGVQDVITLEDGLPVAYNLASGSPAIARRTGYRSNIILLDFSIGWIDMPNGTSSTDPGSEGNAGGTIDLAETDYLLIQGLTIGPQILHAVRPSNGQFHANNIIRGNEFLKHLTSLRRGSRATSLNWSGGSRLYAYDNYWRAGSPRMINFEGSYSWNYFGFNYQEPQSPIEGDTGTGYCWGDSSITPAGGSFPNNTSPGGGPGDRSIFFHGDSGGEDGSGHIIERVRADCVVQLQNAIDYDGFSTFYGIRAEDPRGIGGNYSGGFESAAFGSGNSQHFNLFANLFRKYQRIDQMPNLLGRWNQSRASGDSSPSGSGADWGSTNEVSASAANTNIGTVVLPPSIVFRQNEPPEWWCTEACEWNANMLFGAAETTSNGCKLPAQIRAEGGTCTPP